MKMHILGGGSPGVTNVTEIKKTQTGGGGRSRGVDGLVLEQVENGWIVHLIDTTQELESVFVFSQSDRAELLQFMAKYV
jgi:hypothetical protein